MDDRENYNSVFNSYSYENKLKLQSAFGGRYSSIDPSRGEAPDRRGEDTHNQSQLNPKQAFWIKRRKIRRDALDAIMIEQDKNYTHESRHKHAMNRQRASSGRFLTKEETMKAQSNKE